ncbi:heme biosynthesis protein HemY [Gimibacter soli]|uniref:Heme biosynthesis HemY N-terminal domain-containing protein n=1 Tax=Gimibacter soli TaxID=3024400 RepID=A0AAE9XTB5_9PROT|nr:heme biosynthesis HemY N-terminal domain-containing protein [Gimibacter soli]WCL54775.1 heme biosynthesis HemY N-terminal domain-containing protein [Gimibacter soli]
MIRLALAFAIVLLLAWGATFVADNPGAATLAVGPWVIETSVAALLLAAALLMLATALALALYAWMRRDLPVIGSSAAIKRQSRGLDLVNQALVALAAGDHKLARRLADQSTRLLPLMPMVHLIGAEAAMRAGDHEAAQEKFKALEASEAGKLLGLRGLVQEARRAGRSAEALRLARLAFAEQPKSPWVLKTLFALEVAAGNWAEAEAALQKVAKGKLVDTVALTRHKGALAFARGTEAALKGDADAARKFYTAAHKARGDFAPADAALARLDLKEGKIRQAEKRLKAAWGKAPRPALAAAWRDIDPAESAADSLARVRTLTAGNPAHPLSRALIAEGLARTGETDAAITLVEGLLAEVPSRDLWTLRLKLAEKRGEDTTAIEAALAQAGPGLGWECGDCGHRPVAWQPLCPSCGGFDTFDWLEPGTPRAEPQRDGSMLMLMSGGPSGPAVD